VHPDFDSKPSRNPFDRFPVVAYRVEQGAATTDLFFVFEVDLPNDILGPLAPPAPVSEAQARGRLAELGLTETAIDERIAWARAWMATRVLEPGKGSVSWLPPL
jgi:hypothetical protein